MTAAVAERVSMTRKYRIDAPDLALRLAWVQFTDEDVARVRAAGEILRPDVDEVVREFYDHSFKFPSFEEKVGHSNSSRTRLEAAQRGYLLSLLECRVDDAYVEGRLVIGDRHAVLDVKPRWNVGNYSLFASLMFPRLAAKMGTDELTATIVSMQKIFTFDMSLAVEAYVGGLMDRLVDLNTRLGPSAASLADGSSQVSLAAKEIADACSRSRPA